jgi:hypothetical protein
MKPAIKGFPYFFLRIYHEESASLAECPAGLMMFLRHHFTTMRHHFIICPGGHKSKLGLIYPKKKIWEPLPSESECFSDNPYKFPTRTRLSDPYYFTGERLQSPPTEPCIDGVSRSTVGMSRWYRKYCL